MRAHILVKYVRLLLVGILLTVALYITVPLQLYAADSYLPNRSDMISNPYAGEVSTHVFGFTMANTSQSVSSISFEFCSNSPMANTPCTVPVGLDLTNAVLADQSGDTGFSIHPDSSQNRIILTRPPLNPTAVPSIFQFDNVINPTVPGSHYVRLQTYSSDDATGPDIEEGGVVFSIQGGVNVITEVPPYIRFCAGVVIVSFDCSTATSYLIDLGELRPTQSARATSQFMVATNAPSGYSITLSGTTLTSGNNIINPLASPSGSSVGTSQFGINLRSNTIPSIGNDVIGPGTATPRLGYNVPNQYKFAHGDILVSSQIASANRKFTVSYMANVSSAQPAGVYATTLTFICLANF